MIVTVRRLGEQLCWSEPWMRFSARTSAEPGLSIGEAPASVQEEFLVMGKPVLVASQHSLQRKVR